MLIPRKHLEGIAGGSISLAFRRWRSPTVKAGGTLRTAIGVLAIESVEIVREADISEADAVAAGHASRAALLGELSSRSEGEIYRIRLHVAGPDPREELSRQVTLSQEQIEQIRQKLDRLDSHSSHGPWTRATLIAIAESPGRRAADLAARLGFEKEWLKINIRKLKELGLTQSLETGYQLAPRGQALLSFEK